MEKPERVWDEFVCRNGIWDGPTVPMQTSNQLGRIPLKLAQEAYKEYISQGHGSQTFDRLHERGGFGSGELMILLYARIKRLENRLEELDKQITSPPLPSAKKLPDKCHHEIFRAEVDIHRLIDSGRFQADVRIRCTTCMIPFRFIGLPAGSDLNGAATNPDATEARLAVAPQGQVVSLIDGAIAGFSIRREPDKSSPG